MLAVISSQFRKTSCYIPKSDIGCSVIISTFSQFTKTGHRQHSTAFSWIKIVYHQTSDISRTIVGNKNCWLLRGSWTIACWRCSNYIFIFDLTPGFNGLGKDNCKTRRETFKFGDLVYYIFDGDLMTNSIGYYCMSSYYWSVDLCACNILMIDIISTSNVIQWHKNQNRIFYQGH